MPEDTESYLNIVRKNVWQAIYSSLVFMAAFAYLQPYVETVQNIWW
jgi:phosphatidylserine synthase 2